MAGVGQAVAEHVRAVAGYLLVVSQMSQGLEVATHVHATGATLSLTGDLDLATAPALTHQADHVLRGDPGAELTLDLDQVRFCDSAGIGALIGLRKRCDDVGWLFRVVHPQPAVRRVLVDFTGLGDYLNVM